ncbi:hypothetical protein KAM461_11330 [Aeromonas hydrophila]|nr:hypothetical protein KAM461_11330 [Aeromonas hydrophila]
MIVLPQSHPYDGVLGTEEVASQQRPGLRLASKGASAQEHDHALLAERGQVDGPELVQRQAGMARFILLYGPDVEECREFAKSNGIKVHGVTHPK